MKTTNKPPLAPEFGLICSLLFSPIGGAIFYSTNWKRLGKPQYRWWTWVTIAGLFAMYLIASQTSFKATAGAIVSVWIVIMYVLQKRITPNGTRYTVSPAFIVTLSIIAIGLGFASGLGLNYGLPMGSLLDALKQLIQ
ncbi:hypothetical protein [Alicyclobacillus fastidiosus]|uniref:Uncharacterized protein n=1 Tax=Alicyclobacillus fastidiosus TaxID=392011 RepID=A0ABV5AKY6_9BACL